MNKIVPVRTNLVHIRNDVGRDLSSSGDSLDQALSRSARQNAAPARSGPELTQTGLEHREHPYKIGRFETPIRADDVLRLDSRASQDGRVFGDAHFQRSNGNASRTVFIFD